MPRSSLSHSSKLPQVKRNLHMVLSFSPVGSEFRERLRKFPSLVNCTTIDWFSEWPRDALQTVATQFLADLPGVDAKVDCRPALCWYLKRTGFDSFGAFSPIH